MSIVITDKRQTKIIKDLPDYKGSEVEIYGRLTVGDIYDAAGDNIKLVSLAIKSWNFTDDDGKPLQVSEEVLRNMEYESFEVLLKEIEAFASTQKKTEKNSTSGPSQ